MRVPGILESKHGGTGFQRAGPARWFCQRCPAAAAAAWCRVNDSHNDPPFSTCSNMQIRGHSLLYSRTGRVKPSLLLCTQQSLTGPFGTAERWITEHGVCHCAGPVQVCDVVKPVGQRAGAVEGEALMEHVEGHVLKAVVVQRHLQSREDHNETWAGVSHYVIIHQLF